MLCKHPVRNTFTRILKQTSPLPDQDPARKQSGWQDSRLSEPTEYQNQIVLQDPQCPISWLIIRLELLLTIW